MRETDALAKEKMTLNRILLGMFLTLLFVTAAHAETWYLMAPDQKVMSEPEAATKNESRFGCGADSRHVNRRIFLTAKM